MGFRVSFLKAAYNRPLAKTITPTLVSAYPKVKTFEKNYDHHVTSLDDFAEALRAHAKEFHCLLKAPVKRPIDMCDRRDCTDKKEPCHYLVLDIDGIEWPEDFPPAMDDVYLARVCDHVVKALPEYLQDVSYIGHASARLGLVPRSARVHIFYLLSSPITPDEQKDWLLSVNLFTDTFRRQTELVRGGGRALKYKLDITLADNSHIVYIAPPVLEHIKDPFPNRDHRWVIVNKNTPQVSAFDIRRNSRPIAEYRSAQETRITELRKAAGLSTRDKTKFRVIGSGNNAITFLANPDPGRLTPSYTDRGFCYYNIDGGDSNAYYHPEGRPDFIFNFKGEPTFRWQDFDQEGYESYCQSNVEAMRKAQPCDVFVVIRRDTDAITKVWYDNENERVEFMPTTRDKIEDFYVEHGKLPPQTIPTWTFNFEPLADYLVDYAARRVNLFVPTEILRAPPVIGLATPTLKYGEAMQLEQYVPLAHKILYHVVGSSEPEYNHFVNWLAHIVQFRNKTESAWVLSGVQGTGKNLTMRMMEHILGAAHCKEFSDRNPFDEMHNGWRVTPVPKLLIMLNEFKAAASKNKTASVAALKGAITDPTITLRQMQRDHQNAVSFDNYLIGSNEFDPVVIEDDDRRFNVAPRQHTKLVEAYPELQELTDFLAEVLEASKLLAALLSSWQVDKRHSRWPLMNSAHEQMRRDSRSMIDEFVDEMTHGNAEFLWDLLDANAMRFGSDVVMVQQQLRKRFLDHLNRPMAITAAELSHLHTLHCGKPMYAGALAKTWDRRSGVKIERFGRNDLDGNRSNGVKLTFKTDLTREDLVSPPSNNVVPIKGPQA
jgi:hypothetical protein